MRPPPLASVFYRLTKKLDNALPSYFSLKRGLGTIPNQIEDSRIWMDKPWSSAIGFAVPDEN